MCGNAGKEAVLALRHKIEPKKLAFEIKRKSDLIEIDPKPMLNPCVIFKQR